MYKELVLCPGIGDILFIWVYFGRALNMVRGT